ncbi:MAG TPA: M14 family metallopeptidase [Gemmatimonadaceae bacterium]|nr:M14 family metallopeptidase [Gemmatimonadaceae bacterium]
MTSSVPPAVRNETSPSGPRTRAERSNYLETSTYADVIVFLDSLHGRPELSFGTIGKTTQGRDIPYVIASRPRVSTPQEAKALNRPIVYVQANIHAGEVEGKEALLAMLRDLTAPGRTDYLDKLILIAVPIYNADGNEKFAHQDVNRGEQNGPEMVGERANAQGLDLNRDYIKAEAPETRASLAMFNAWDPDVFVDLHTTDGSFHGYALTYSPSLNPAAPLGIFTRDQILPALRSRMQARGFATFDYGNFISDDTLSKGWETFDSRPRFGTNYYGLRGRISILSEAYSHDPFKRRIEATYAFVDEILKVVIERSAEIRKLTALASATYPTVESIPIRSRMIAAPQPIDVIAEQMERTGDSSRTQPGVPKGMRRSGKFQTIKMPVFDRFEPTFFAPRPPAYAIAASEHEAVAVLRAHGIIVYELAANSTARGDRFIVDSAKVAPRLFQKHHEVQLTGRWVSEERELRAGTYIVRTNQPLGLLAVYLLEPQTDDGLVTWNVFDETMVFGSSYPVLRLMNEPRPVTR